MRQIDLAKDPYHVVRLERADHQYPLPRVAIEGTFDAPMDEHGNRLFAFEKSSYDI
jgi:hypothetical protein